MISLTDKAPLLISIWPYALAVGSGMALVKLIDLWTRGGAIFVQRQRKTTVTFSPVEPSDEDNYVFRDDDAEGSELEDNASTCDESEIPHVPYFIHRLGDEEMMNRSESFYKLMNTRRTVRFFSQDSVPLYVIRNIIRTAGTSPSGAHTEPWTYVLVSDPKIKKHIRAIVEEEEEVNYRRRMGDTWVADLAPLKTDWNKPYLEEAPYILIVFKQMYGLTPDGKKKNHYYNEISTSISIGLLLAALTNVGLTTVTTTPMNAGHRLRSLLKRPANEKVLAVLPIGFPADNATVPDLERKPLEQIMVHI